MQVTDIENQLQTGEQPFIAIRHQNGGSIDELFESIQENGIQHSQVKRDHGSTRSEESYQTLVSAATLQEGNSSQKVPKSPKGTLAEIFLQTASLPDGSLQAETPVLGMLENPQPTGSSQAKALEVNASNIGTVSQQPASHKFKPVNELSKYPGQLERTRVTAPWPFVSHPYLRPGSTGLISREPVPSTRKTRQRPQRSLDSCTTPNESNGTSHSQVIQSNVQSQPYSPGTAPTATHNGSSNSQMLQNQSNILPEHMVMTPNMQWIPCMNPYQFAVPPNPHWIPHPAYHQFNNAANIQMAQYAAQHRMKCSSRHRTIPHRHGYASHPYLGTHAAQYQHKCSSKRRLVPQFSQSCDSLVQNVPAAAQNQPTVCQKPQMTSQSTQTEPQMVPQVVQSQSNNPANSQMIPPAQNKLVCPPAQNQWVHPTNLLKVLQPAQNQLKDSKPIPATTQNQPEGNTQTSQLPLDAIQLHFSAALKANLKYELQQSNISNGGHPQLEVQGSAGCNGSNFQNPAMSSRLMIPVTRNLSQTLTCNPPEISMSSVVQSTSDPKSIITSTEGTPSTNMQTPSTSPMLKLINQGNALPLLVKEKREGNPNQPSEVFGNFSQGIDLGEEDWLTSMIENTKGCGGQ